MKLLKKLSMYVLIVAIIATSGIVFTACGDPKEPQVMSLSVNPGVEFILDKDDKVISVSADNEDGAYILDKFTTFTGMSAKDAALKFLELSEQYGFVVEGSTNGEKFTISVSGEGADKLYHDVKGKINSKVSQLGLSIDNMVTMAKTDLETKVAECYQEYTSSELASKSYEELVNMLKASREETKNLFTNEEKQEYYRERAQKVMEATIDAIEEYLSENPSLNNLVVTTAVAAMDVANSALTTAYNTINATLDSLYSVIDTKREEYIAKKQAYLDAVEEYRTALENSASNVEELKDTMESLKEQANDMYDTLKTKRDEAIQELRDYVDETLGTLITTLNEKMNAVLTHISAATAAIDSEVQTVINNLKTEYSNASVNPWAE